jgi:hypothetical protein
VSTPQASPTKKPVVFVGSSAEAKNIAAAIEVNMHHDYSIKVWTAGVFEPSSYPLADLEKQAGVTSFGIFVFERDDVVEMRGAKHDVTRDNVVFELGLFLGRLGRENCFIVVPKNRSKLHLPSDLDGYAPLVYDDALAETDLQAALSPVCSMIRLTIRKRSTPEDAPTTSPHTAGPSTALAHQPKVASHIQDLLDMVVRGKSGLLLKTANETTLKTWSQTTLKMGLDSIRAMSDRPEDTYIIWLKPLDGSPDELAPYLSENTPATYDQHYRFGRGEGLAGSVWALGQAALHSPTEPHPAWKIRAGCDNASYIAVPIGIAGGSGGVLAVGSDTGFTPTADDVEVLKVYAAALALGA